MNLLFLSTKSPYPAKEGHTLRTYNLLKYSAGNNNIFFLTYFLSAEEKESFGELKKICRQAFGFDLQVNKSVFLLFWGLLKNLFSPLPFVCQKYRTKDMYAQIKLLMRQEKIDLVHVDMLPLMNYYELIKDKPVVLVDHNVESLLLKRQVEHSANLFMKIFFWLQYLKLYKFEKEQISRAKCCVAVSEQDKNELKKMNPAAIVKVVPNGTDINYFRPDYPKNELNQLIFVGGLNWLPNLDGVTYFLEEIYPEVKKQTGEVDLIVVGKVKEGFKYKDMVKQVGYVPDIRPFVNNAKVFIVPLRIGGGTRLKILDAMAMGKAIVSTSIGCEGLEATDGKQIIIKDNPCDFANAVVDLLSSSQKRMSLGENARRFVEDKYRWELIGEKMNRIYSETVQ
jgi:glycosyltransferase involved in cell wall biosynthesis